jgi:hypothetical protein
MEAARAVWTDWASATHAASSAGFCWGRVTEEVVDVAEAVVEVVATAVGAWADEPHAGTTAKRATAPTVTQRGLLRDTTVCTATSASLRRCR